MRLFKKIDFYIQISLIAASLLYIFFTDLENFIVVYFVVGGWQLFSCMMHAFCRKFYTPSFERKGYVKSVAWLIAIPVGIAILIFTGAMLAYFIGFAYGIGLLFITPAFAVWYVNICHIEIRMLEHRELVHLK